MTMSPRSLCLLAALAVLSLVALAPACTGERLPPVDDVVAPEACVTLGSCCETLVEGEASGCRAEVAAASSSATGGVRCTRGLADYRDRGFCGGKAQTGSGSSPGCALLSACCASLDAGDERDRCDAALAEAGQTSASEDACVAAHEERIAARLCTALPVAARGPRCEALSACCASLASDARSSCEDSVAQLVTLADAEASCEASEAAYQQAGLCLDVKVPPPAPICGLVAPAEDACCTCPPGKTCDPNGCYNGYLCNPAGCTCGKRPTSGPCAAATK
jgi:hypothetical protein